MKTIKKIILAVALIGVAECAHAVTGGIITDLITRGSTTTVRCSQNSDRGKIFVDTDAVSGQQIYACEGSSGWKLQGDGGGAGSGDIEGVTAGNGLTGGGTSGTVTLSLDPNATNYIRNQNSPLTPNNTFYVSSGTVKGQLTMQDDSPSGGINIDSRIEIEAGPDSNTYSRIENISDGERPIIIFTHSEDQTAGSRLVVGPGTVGEAFSIQNVNGDRFWSSGHGAGYGNTIIGTTGTITGIGTLASAPTTLSVVGEVASGEPILGVYSNNYGSGPLEIGHNVSTFTTRTNFTSSMTLSGGVLVQNVAPSNGQVLKFDGTNWAPGTDNNSGGGGSSVYNATSTAGFPYGFSASTGVFTSSVVAYAYYLYVPGTGIQSTQNNRFDFFTNGILWGSINSDGDWSFGGVESYDRDHLLKADGSTVFNDQGLDADFRIESSVSNSSIFLEGSNGNVGIGTNTPVNKLDVYGVVRSTGLIMRNLSPGVMYVVAGSSVVETAATGVINVSTNPVDWTLLKNVPAGFADGVDATGGGGGTTITVQEGGSTVVETSTLTFNAAQFNIADLTGKGSVVIDTMTAGGIMALSTGTNSAGQLVRLDSSADVPDANLSASVSLLGSQIDISGETNLTASNGVTLTDDALTVNWSSAISRSDVAAAYQPLDATLTDLAAAPLGEDNSISVAAIAAGLLPTDVIASSASAAMLVSSFPVNGVVAGTYGSSTQIATFTVNAQGFVTGVSTISFAAGDNVSVNESATTNADFDDNEPVAVSNNVNVTWQTDGTNISGQVPFNSATMELVGGALSAIAGAGDMILASTQTSSGAKTFLSSTTLKGPVLDRSSGAGSSGQVLASSGPGLGVYWTTVSAGGGSSTAQSTGTANIYIDAAAFQVLQSSFAPLSNISTTTTKSAVRLFDDTAREYVDFKFRVPPQLMNDANVTFRADIGAVTAASGKNAKFDLEYYCAANGESWQGALSTTTSGNFPLSATQDIVTQATWTATITSLGWSAGDVCFARLSRDPAATNDLTGDVRLYGLSIGIPVNASGSNFFNKTYQAANARLPGVNSPYISNSTSSASAGVFFDETSTQSVTWSDILSPYNGGTLNADVIFLSSATSGTMNWGVYLECITSNVDAVSGETDSFGVVNSTSVTVGATSLMSNKATVALTNGDSCASGDEIRIKLERQAQSSDTAVGMGRVRRMRIYETP